MKREISICLTLSCLFMLASTFTVQNPLSCDTTYYFNMSTLACQSCSSIANSMQSSDGTSCVCMSGFYATYDANTQKLVSCTSCGNQYTFPGDYTKCYTGGSGMYTGYQYPTCTSDNQIPYLSSKTVVACRACPYNQYAVAKVTNGSCIKCPHPRQKYQKISGVYTCSCTGDANYVDLAGTTTCILSNSTIMSNLETDYYITYNFIEGLSTGISASKVKSAFFTNNFLQAYYECAAFLSNTYCQVLANICVLNMYDTNNALCKNYNQLLSNLPSVTNQTYYEYF